MADPAVGLAEKMTWFWHAHLCTSVDKVGSWSMMWNQHMLLRNNALGNFRTLLQQLTIDPAMLIYLDGDPSVVTAPNENYSREVMELFAMGPGNYTETDVRNGAKALAGWDVNWETGVATFFPQYALTTPVPFLGKQRDALQRSRRTRCATTPRARRSSPASCTSSSTASTRRRRAGPSWRRSSATPTSRSARWSRRSCATRRSSTRRCA